MKSTAVVFEHQFDEELLEQIESLRSVRLSLAEKMLADLPKTMADLKAQGFDTGGPEINEFELRAELVDKVSMLRSRIENPEVIYADEISFYVDLIDKDATIEHVEIF